MQAQQRSSILVRFMLASGEFDNLPPSEYKSELQVGETLAPEAHGADRALQASCFGVPCTQS